MPSVKWTLATDRIHTKWSKVSTVFVQHCKNSHPFYIFSNKNDDISVEMWIESDNDVDFGVVLGSKDRSMSCTICWINEINFLWMEVVICKVFAHFNKFFFLRWRYDWWKNSKISTGSRVKMLKMPQRTCKHKWIFIWIACCARTWWTQNHCDDNKIASRFGLLPFLSYFITKSIHSPNRKSLSEIAQ